MIFIKLTVNMNELNTCHSLKKSILTMFVAFMGKPDPRIYIQTKVNINICLLFSKSKVYTDCFIL